MSILVDKNTRVICQGLGKAGTFHAIQCREYGTQMVGGISPGKGGQTKEGFPLFNTVAEAMQKTGANASMKVPTPGRAVPMSDASHATAPSVITESQICLLAGSFPKSIVVVQPNTALTIRPAWRARRWRRA